MTLSRRLVPLAVTVALLAPVLLAAIPQAQAEEYRSRLSQLIQQKPSLYLPSRLVMGEENRFVFRAKAGSKVQLFISPKAEGMVLDNGDAMRVGEDHETLGGVIPANGVLEMAVPIPSNPDWEGKLLYVDALISTDNSGLVSPVSIDFVDSTGRRTGDNSLVLTKAATKVSGPSIMPNMPGIDPNLFKQVTQLTDIYGNKDDHRKQYLDDGTIDRSNTLDKNPMFQRPGSIMPGVR